jgi:hypothetical protein
VKTFEPGAEPETGDRQSAAPARRAAHGSK